MARAVLIVLASICLTNCAFGQFVLQGRVLSRPGKNSIPYANIGIVNTKVGTISNEDGGFSISIPERFENDTLIFSALGFGRRLLPIRVLKKDSRRVIYLNERTSVLEPVTVNAGKEKFKSFRLGNQRFRVGTVLIDSIYAGSSVALLIQNKPPFFHEDLIFPVYLQKARVRILRNNMKHFKLRLRVYDVDSLTGYPGRDLLAQSLITGSEMKKGWLEFDLSQLNLRISEPSFFVAFEWIVDDSDRLLIAQKFRDFKKKYPQKISFSTVFVDGRKVTLERLEWEEFPGTALGISTVQASLNNFQCYKRLNSFGKWERASGILSAKVVLRNQPKSKDILFSADPEALEQTTCVENDLTCRSSKLCNDFLEEYQVSGAQLAILSHGNMKLSKGYGLADIDSNLPVTSNTRFRIGSVSKAITSAGMMKLVAERKLDMDVPVQKYVPSFPRKKYDFTTRQLAGDVAGIRHYDQENLGDFVRTDHYASSTEAIKIFANDTLLFKPGTYFHYSSFGWNLIGAVIEGASGKNYLKYMNSAVWTPMGMKNTCGDVADSLIADRSKFYDVTGGEAEFEDLSFKYPSGGLLSTAEDLVKFGNQMLHGGVLSPALTKILFETQYVQDDIPTNCGLGWHIGEDVNGHRIWFHSGDLQNSSAYLVIYPDDDLVLAFLANSQDGLAFDIGKIGEMFYSNQ